MTAENRAPIGRRPLFYGASMRPRPMTAENRGGRKSRTTWKSRFNEAAADDRGKPR